jgi:hypothetical protein
MKKLLIALLGINALLIALLTAQSVQSAPKSYDAVKLAQYEKCVGFYNNNIVGQGSSNLGGYPELFEFHLKMCAKYKP